MEIRRLGNINPTENSSSSSKINNSSEVVSKSSHKDSLKVSDEARSLEDEAFIKDVIARIPDMDIAKVNSIKQKIECNEYNNKEAIDILTARLMKVLGV